MGTTDYRKPAVQAVNPLFWVPLQSRQTETSWSVPHATRCSLKIAGRQSCVKLESPSDCHRAIAQVDLRSS